MNYNEWLAEVDQHIIDKIGISLHDLEDYNWHDWYSEGIDAQTTAEEYIDDFLYDNNLHVAFNAAEYEPTLETVYNIMFTAMRGEHKQYRPSSNCPYHLGFKNDGFHWRFMDAYRPDIHVRYYPDEEYWTVSYITDNDDASKTVYQWDNVDNEWDITLWTIS